MQLKKDKEIINLDNEAHIKAFLQSGWEEVKETKASKQTKSTTKSTKNSRGNDEA